MFFVSELPLHFVQLLEVMLVKQRQLKYAKMDLKSNSDNATDFTEDES